MIKIQLVDTVKGLLDLKEGSNFPINMGISDIRDITKRSGLFSKTITLIGNKNNNTLLGSIYDVNVETGAFDINKLQKCQVVDGGEVILDNLYFQLLSVNKKSNNVNDEQYIEYEAVIKDTVGDFFTRINQLELTDLDLSDLSYKPDGNLRRLNSTEIEATFGYTASTGFKYVLPWLDPNASNTSVKNPSNTYNLNEIKPGVFAKVYWDRIFSNAGYRYEWDTLDNDLVQFDKLVIPYNGDEKQMLPDIQSQYEVNLESANVKVFTVRPSTFTASNGYWGFYDSVTAATFSVDVNDFKDLENQWNPTTQQFTNALAVSNTHAIEVEFVFDYTLLLINNEAVTIRTNGSLPIQQVDINVFPTFRIYKNNGLSLTNPAFNSMHYYGTGDENGYIVPYAQVYSPGNTTLKTGSMSIKVPITALLSGGLLNTFRTGIALYGMGDDKYVFPGFVRTTDLGTADMRYRLTYSNMKLNFKPSLTGIDYNFPIIMNGYIPRKIKQTDFISSIAKLYNLYFEPDVLDKNKIIIKTRDTYYDSGEILDWTNKLNKNVEQNIQFLPELSTKSIILSYKDDKDIANTLYKNATNETYGQIEYIFENEYTRGVDRKEVIFSPTPTAVTSFGTYMPVLNGYNPSSNMRLLIDGGVVSGKTYYFNQNGTQVTLTNSPLLSHFAGDQTQPVFDINYGVCDYYFYNLQNPTYNNLFNIHWRRTFNQINSGKMMTAQFDLNTTDIRTLKLNSNIRINNSYWNINKIIDFNASVKSPTKVELISIDENTSLAPFLERVVKTPLPNEGINLINSGWQLESRNYYGNNVNVIGYGNTIDMTTTGVVSGNNNYITSQSNSPIIVSGDSNVATAQGVTIFGDFNNVDSEGTLISGNNNTVDVGLSGVNIFGSNITATQSNTTYTENIIMSPGSTLNGTPINDITTSAIEDITYSDLYNLWLNELLIPGQVYRITDFQTIYDQPDYDAGGVPKTPVTLSGLVRPILVRANANDTLEDQAWGFAGAIIIKYDISFNQTEVNGTPAKGRITYMLDIFRNESFFNHIDILIKRYETINGSGVYDNYRDTGFSSFDTQAISGYNNKIGINIGYVDFIIPNNIINASVPINDNEISSECYNNTILNGSSNKIGTNSSNILINGSYNEMSGVSATIIVNGNYNKIGWGSTGITINGNGNILGDNCDAIIFNTGCNDNIIGNNCQIINFGTNCFSNMFGDGNNNTTLGNSSNSNVFGDFCFQNILGANCNNNVFENFCDNITLGIDCDSNNFGNYCNNNILGDSSANNTFGNEASNNTLGIGVNFNLLESGSFNNNINGSYNNIGSDSSDNTITDDYNIIGKLCSNNTINGPYNKLGTDCFDNIINGDRNILGISCGTNTVNGSSNNKFDNGCNDNQLIGSCFDNIFGNGCSDNQLTSSNDNIFGNGSSLNILNNANHNELGNNSDNTITGDYNKIGNESYSNTINGNGNVIGDLSVLNIINGDYNILADDNDSNNITGDYNKFGLDCASNIISGGARWNTLMGHNNSNTISGSEDIIISSGISNRTFSTTNNDLSTNVNQYIDNLTLSNTTTTDAVIKNLYTFTPRNGYYSFECVVIGNEVATGDTIIVKGFAGFKVIGGVVTQISTSTIDRKSNFPAGVNITIDTDGTLIRLRVTGRNASVINWEAHRTITTI